MLTWLKNQLHTASQSFESEIHTVVHIMLQIFSAIDFKSELQKFVFPFFHANFENATLNLKSGDWTPFAI